MSGSSLVTILYGFKHKIPQNPGNPSTLNPKPCFKVIIAIYLISLQRFAGAIFLRDIFSHVEANAEFLGFMVSGLGFYRALS